MLGERIWDTHRFGCVSEGEKVADASDANGRGVLVVGERGGLPFALLKDVVDEVLFFAHPWLETVGSFGVLGGKSQEGGVAAAEVIGSARNLGRPDALTCLF